MLDQKMSGILLEYLTDEQRKKFSRNKMSKDAREATDHYFGQDNDFLRQELSSPAHHEKSEIHRAIEKHLGKEISHDEYKSGRTKDKYDRDAKIGKLIKDKDLRDQFATDPAREGSKKLANGNYITVVRGTEVAGQTNSEPDENHPRGHSWGEISCKNVDTGLNKHYLKDEIKHGTAVVRAHDHNGQEIYRGTLQPYINKGSRAYSLDAEYGIKQPDFTDHAMQVAKDLSGEYKEGLYTKHKDVYDDNGIEHVLHPNTSKEKLLDVLDNGGFEEQRAAVSHPNIDQESLIKAFKGRYQLIRNDVALNPKLSSESLTKLFNDPDIHDNNKADLLNHRNITSEHISNALNNDSETYREAAIYGASNTGKLKGEHIDQILSDEKNKKSKFVLAALASHPNLSDEQISKFIDARGKENDQNFSDSIYGRELLHNQKNVSRENLHKILDNSSSRSTIRAVLNQSNGDHPEIIDRIIKLNDNSSTLSALEKKNVTPEHINHILDNYNETNIKMDAISHPNASEENITKALQGSNPMVASKAMQHPNVNDKHIEMAKNSEFTQVGMAAKRLERQRNIDSLTESKTLSFISFINTR